HSLPISPCAPQPPSAPPGITATHWCIPHMAARRKQEIWGARDAEVMPFFLGTRCPGPAGLRGSLRQRQDVRCAELSLAALGQRSARLTGWVEVLPWQRIGSGMA